MLLVLLMWVKIFGVFISCVFFVVSVLLIDDLLIWCVRLFFGSWVMCSDGDILFSSC